MISTETLRKIISEIWMVEERDGKGGVITHANENKC